MTLKVLSFGIFFSLFWGNQVQATDQGEFCDRHGRVVKYICGAVPIEPGWVLGQDGCWYLTTERTCQPTPVPPAPTPSPTPQPPTPPPQPPYPPQTRMVRCESYGFGYFQCYLGFQVRRVTLVRQWSYEPCIPYQTFGAMNDRMWVANGCRGDFFVEYWGY